MGKNKLAYIINEEGRKKHLKYIVEIIYKENKNYYAVKFNEESGEIVRVKRCKKPKTIINKRGVKWHNIPVEVRKMNYRNIFRSDNSEYMNYVHGGNNKNSKTIKFEKWLNNQQYIPTRIAWEVYKAIGEFEKIEVIYSYSRGGEYCIDQKYYLTINRLNNTYVIKSQSSKCNDAYIKDRAKELNIPIKMADITRFITDENTAKNILERLKNLKTNSRVMSMFEDYNENCKLNNKELSAQKYSSIKEELVRIFGKDKINQMDLSKKKFSALTQFLLESS